MSKTLHTIRRSIWAISITAVTVAGAWYGAGLKMQQDHKKVCPNLPFAFRDGTY